MRVDKNTKSIAHKSPLNKRQKAALASPVRVSMSQRLTRGAFRTSSKRRSRTSKLGRVSLAHQLKRVSSALSWKLRGRLL